MDNYLTYLYLLTPLHTGGSANEGNLMGIAREVHTEFPYMPASSLRGRIRAAMEQKHENDDLKETVQTFFGQRIEAGGQPTEGEVWFADATLLFFPIASLSHHLIWITCPLWLDRWSRWLGNDQKQIQSLIKDCQGKLREKAAITTFKAKPLYLQTALLKVDDIDSSIDLKFLETRIAAIVADSNIFGQIEKKLVIINNEDCVSLVETGLQREVRVALNKDEKTVKEGSFRSEEAIPPETILFFPWAVKSTRPFSPRPGMKPEDIEKSKSEYETKSKKHSSLKESLNTLLKNRLQFGGLEGLGRGWSNLKTDNIKTN
ncbi:MAG: type III-B CRISPR module RAMP protein Cmr4 [Nodosilinea sp.]